MNPFRSGSSDSRPGISSGETPLGPRERDGDTPRTNHQTFSVEYQLEPLHPAVWGPPRPISQSRYINGELEPSDKAGFKALHIIGYPNARDIVVLDKTL